MPDNHDADGGLLYRLVQGQDTEQLLQLAEAMLEAARLSSVKAHTCTEGVDWNFARAERGIRMVRSALIGAELVAKEEAEQMPFAYRGDGDLTEGLFYDSNPLGYGGATWRPLWQPGSRGPKGGGG